ncbi:MAG TPA: DUF1801 domain-containing protein [Ferruginibacter sp.]|nr:DUF1801 domain-containing protein [Ferruginibacter sp.]
MKSTATDIEAYFDGLPIERKAPMQALYKTITDHLPKGFEPTMQYGMISFVVPHSIYPDGYHCKPTDALPFLSIASQKNFIALYHMGIYADAALLQWFTNAYTSAAIGKLDMGKSCIRFKKVDKIPMELIANLCTKMTVKDWIKLYEKIYKK